MKLPTLHIPLAQPGFRVLRSVQWVLTVVVLAAPMCGGWLWLESRGVEQAALQYEETTARVTARTQTFKAQATAAGIDLTEPRLQTLAQEVTFANQLLEKRGFSWTRLLGDLEQAVPDRVSLASVNLNFTDSTISLRGAARTLKDLTAFVDSLERHPAFSHVVVSRHQIHETVKARRNPTAAYVSFSLVVRYQSAS